MPLAPFIQFPETASRSHRRREVHSVLFVFAAQALNPANFRREVHSFLVVSAGSLNPASPNHPGTQLPGCPTIFAFQSISVRLEESHFLAGRTWSRAQQGICPELARDLALARPGIDLELFPARGQDSVTLRTRAPHTNSGSIRTRFAKPRCSSGAQSPKGEPARGQGIVAYS